MLDLSNRNREYDEPSAPELRAIARVNRTPSLKQYEQVIFADWRRWEDHMAWVATAPISEITEWALWSKAHMECRQEA